jgi:ADP-ribosylglycohydrolase
VVYAFGYPDDRGDLFAWAEGEGPLLRNGLPAASPPPATLGPQDVVLVSANGDRDPETNFRAIAPARYRAVPSIAHRLALVAAGEAAATISLFAPGAWDYAAGQALLRAVSGILVDQDGREVTYAADGSSRCRRAFGGAAAVAERLARESWGFRGGALGESAVFARLRPGEAVADPERLARAQGCLLGQVAGDNLGGLVEFRSGAEIRQLYPEGPLRLEDGGHWDILAGQPTDDSEMALALSRSVLATGRFDSSEVLDAYRAWRASDPFDVGTTIAAALLGDPRKDSQSNGSLMRASPLGLMARTREEAAVLARADSALTHPHAVCADASAALLVAIRHAVQEGGGPRAAYDAALDWARSARAEGSVQAALAAAAEAPPPVCDGESQGFVLIALQNAFHELLHAPSLEAGVVATVRRGGDTDTNAAIAGALLGSAHGASAVPAQWRSMILSCRPHALRGSHPRPMGFWPVDVLELAERLLHLGSA